MYLNQGGLGLSNRDYYLRSEPEYSNVKAAYQTYVQRILALVGWADPPSNASRIVAMEILHRRGPLEEIRHAEYRCDLQSCLTRRIGDTSANFSMAIVPDGGGPEFVDTICRT